MNRFLCASLLVSASLAVASCRGSGDTDFTSGVAGDPVVLLVVDALRADHLGCYGYPRDTSPAIDALAAEGIVFDDAIANSSFTRQSISTLLSGRLPSSAGSTGWTARPPTDVPMLAERFRAAGYETAFVSGTGVLRDAEFTRGFDRVEHLTERWDTSGQSRTLTQRALETVRGFGAGGFFLYLHYLDPHGPYRPPAEQELPWTAPALPPGSAPLDLYRQVRRRCRELVEEGLGPGDPRFEELVSRYDAEIVDVDRAIAELVAGLDELGVLDRALIVITSDHGEEFLEHDFVEHAWTLYQESLEVPWIFWSRKIARPRRVAAPVSHVDLVPTLIELAELDSAGEPPATDLDGTPLFRRAGRGWAFEPPARPRIAELLIDHRNRLRAVLADGWKYIAAERWLTLDERSRARKDDVLAGADDRLWRPVVREELYDLMVDPGERDDRSQAAPERLAEFRRRLASYRELSERREADRRAADEAAEPAISSEAEEALRSLGYLD